eukprot:scaffold34975_cov66-Phaeocystis_antarctica.AAC.3
MGICHITASRAGCAEVQSESHLNSRLILVYLAVDQVGFGCAAHDVEPTTVEGCSSVVKDAAILEVRDAIDH